jgi:oligopeptide transport system substrate-binding protein
MNGGELTVQSFEPGSLDPHFGSFAQEISLYRMLWRGLYELDANNEPRPAMASGDAEISEDGLTYSVPLRDGLKWSDGDDLTAEDFVAGIHRTCNPDNAGKYQYLIYNVVGCDAHYTNEGGFDADLEEAIGVRVVDNTRLEFTLSEAQPTFGTILALWMTFPSPVHLLPNSGDPWPTDPAALVYNGPYILVDNNPGDSAVLEPNPEWSAPEDVSPTLDRVVIRFIDDLSVAENAYRTGEIQATAVELSTLQVAVSDFGAGDEYFAVPAPANSAVYINLSHPPLDNLDVRLALSRAIDRDTLNEVAYDGAGRVTTSWIPESSGGHANSEFEEEIGFDPEEAKARLAAAGYPDGDGFPTLVISAVGTPTAQAAAVFLQEAFRTHLNLDFDVETADIASLGLRVQEGDFHLVPDLGWVQDYPDPENWVLGQFESTGPLNNYGCSEPEIDALVEEARFNTDDEERRAQYLEINELVVTRLCGVIPYQLLSNHWLIKPNVVGMREHLSARDASMPGDAAAEYWGLSE